MSAPPVGSGTTFLQAKTANEVLKAQERRLRTKLKGKLIDRARALSLVFRLARQSVTSGSTGLRAAALMAADLGVSPRLCRRFWRTMSVPSSTISPRSNPISGEDDFDGATEILRAWCEGLTPDPDLTVSEWADRHRMLSGRASAEPGRYRTARTPYMGEIMDRLSPGDPTQRIVFMKAAQVGATEAGNNWIASRSTRRRARCSRSSRPWNWRNGTQGSGSTKARSCGSVSNRRARATRATPCCPRNSQVAS